MVVPRPFVNRGGLGLSLEPLVAFIGHVFASHEADDRHGDVFSICATGVVSVLYVVLCTYVPSH